MATSIRLPPDLEKRFDFLADQTGRPKSYYLKQLLENGIEDLEDYYLSADVLERIRRGEDKTMSASDVRADLGLDL
jgi:RHH-type rel operon transcriptional repressor/antitoxin RelB